MNKEIANEIIGDILHITSGISLAVKDECGDTRIQNKVSILYALVDDLALEVGLQ